MSVEWIAPLIVGVCAGIAVTSLAVFLRRRQRARTAVDDIRETAAALKDSEERFRGFFEEMPVPMYRTRLDGTIVHANTALARMLGIDDPAELVDVNAASFYVEDGERARLAGIQQEQGVLEDQVSLLQSSDGREIWVRDSSHTVVDGGGQIFEGALIDVTAGENATKELELRARQQEALAHVGQVALRSDDLSEVLQESVEQICSVLDLECAIVAQDRDGYGVLTTASAFGTDSARRRETLLSYLQEHTFAAEGIAAPLQFPLVATVEPEGSIGGAAVNVPGPSESFGVIAAGGASWQPSAQDLSFLVAIATTLGFAIERAQARVRLQRLMRSKDEFVASVSHELRTPLTVVAGLAHELESAWRSFSASEIAEFISLIADQSSEMTDLIEDLLVAARADIGKVPVHMVAHELRESVDLVVAACSLADRARITVAGQNVVAVVDPGRFRQIVRNLVSNAIRYGGPRIHVAVEAVDGKAKVSVFDDGAGVPAGDRKRIFDAYQRAHSTSGVPGSVGLGLTVSQELADLMDGSIGYTYSGGSIFEVSFAAVAPPQSDIDTSPFGQVI